MNSYLKNQNGNVLQPELIQQETNSNKITNNKIKQVMNAIKETNFDGEVTIEVVTITISPNK